MADLSQLLQEKQFFKLKSIKVTLDCIRYSLPYLKIINIWCYLEIEIESSNCKIMILTNFSLMKTMIPFSRKKKVYWNKILPPYLHNYVSVSKNLYPRWLTLLPFEVNLHFYAFTALWTKKFLIYLSISVLGIADIHMLSRTYILEIKAS